MKDGVSVVVVEEGNEAKKKEEELKVRKIFSITLLQQNRCPLLLLLFVFHFPYALFSSFILQQYIAHSNTEPEVSQIKLRREKESEDSSPEKATATKCNRNYLPQRTRSLSFFLSFIHWTHDCTTPHHHHHHHHPSPLTSLPFPFPFIPSIALFCSPCSIDRGSMQQQQHQPPQCPAISHLMISQLCAVH